MQVQSQSPYFNDFDPDKGFHQLLFRPGYAVQARELTQIQSVLQDQIGKFGRHIFQNGSAVLGGETTLDKNVKAIRIEDTYSSADVDLTIFENTNVKGVTSGLEVPVVYTATISSQKYIFVALKGTETFTDGETLQVYTGSPLAWENAATLISSGAQTSACLFSMKDGVFFHDDYFVGVAAQTLVVSTTSSSPSYRIGLTVASSIVDEVQDTSLLDPALGAPNENAPGAHRLKILMTLEAKDLSSEPSDDFIELVRVDTGDVRKNVTIPVYSEIEKTLARRTYDESGNYTVRPFKMSVKDISDINDWEAETVADSTARSVLSLSLDFTAKTLRFGIFDTNGGSPAETVRAQGYVKVTGNTVSAAGTASGFTASGNLVDNGSDLDFDDPTYPSGVSKATWAGNGMVFDFTASTEKSFELTFTSAFDENTLFEIYLEPATTTLEQLHLGSKHLTTEFIGEHLYEEAIDVKKATNYNIEIDQGKAYIFGQEFETISKETVILPKARTSKQVQNYAVGIEYGSYAIVDNLSGYFSVEALQTVYLCSGSTLDAVTLEGSPSTVVGTAKVREIVKYGTAYKLFLFDLSYTGSNTFESVNTIFGDSTYSATIGQCKIATTGKVNSKAVLFETNTSSLIFPIAQPVIKTVKPGGTLDASYTCRVKHTGTFSGGSLTLSAGSDRQFLSGADNYIIVKDSDGSIITPNSVSLGGGGSSVTITKSGAAYAATILAPVFIQVAPLATKTLVENATFSITGNTSTYYNSARRFYTVRKSDVFQIVSVVTTGSVDITDRFTLDTGQRDNYYDHGGLILKTGQSVSAGEYPLTVTFDYFTHNGPGFFAVDSYSDVDYADIPTYVSPDDGSTYPLRDVIDFRPRREDDAISTKNIDAYTGGNLLPAVTGSNVLISDYEFYLPRRDKLVLNRDKQFEIIPGVPDLNPVAPPDSPNAMTLYSLYVPAYSFRTAGVIQSFVENKRYTMRDIGALEKRIENLEYYTTLSLLEKDTIETDIRDDAGLTRFKNGIIVDSFTGHGVGDVGNIDYKCSVDFTNNFLRAPFVARNYALTLDEGSSSGFTKGGDTTNGYVVTLPYTTTALVTQPLASKVENLNPYMVIKHVGTLAMNPPSDDWVDTTTRPDIAVNLQGDRDAWEYINQSVNGEDTDGFGTQWNDWETIWTGETVSTINTSSILRDIDINRFTGFGRDTVLVDGGTNFTQTIRSTTQTQTRTGLRTTVSPETITQRVDDLVTDVSIRPYMRQTDIAWSVQGLRPNRRLYLFFDGVAIQNRQSDYTTAATATTDSNGAASGYIRIPAGTFRTGDREFVVIDDPANDKGVATTYASSKFHASGLTVTRQGVVVSTRVPQVTQEVVTETRTLPTITIPITPPTRIDPLAQTFFVDSAAFPNGLFLSSVAVYFKSKSKTNVPVRLEIRPTVNGYPDSNTVVPLSVVYKNPSAITVSETGTAATTFTFPAPLYLPPGEHAVVLLADSQEYEVFVSELGKTDLISSKIIGTQPYMGSLFKSQNASTWTPAQEEDLKMTLNRCVFSTSPGTVYMQVTSSDTFNYNLSKYLSDNLTFNESTKIDWQQETRNTSNVSQGYEGVLANKNKEWETARRISGSGTLIYKGTLTTTDPAISPFMDLTRQSVFLVKNIIGTGFTDEDTAKDGAALAKYVTRRVILDDGFNADSMRIWFSAIRPQESDIKVYVKVLAAEDSDLFDDRDYILITDTNNLNTYSSSDNDWREFSYDIAAGDLDYTNSSGNDFTTFNSYAIKLVMLSSNTSRVPKIKDLRGVSLE